MAFYGNNRRGLLIVISGASGTGKGTVIKALFDKLPNLVFSVSATTRLPRVGEKDGVNYHFMSREEFEREIAADAFDKGFCSVVTPHITGFFYKTFYFHKRF